MRLRREDACGKAARRWWVELSTVVTFFTYYALRIGELSKITHYDLSHFDNVLWYEQSARAPCARTRGVPA